MSSPTPRQLHDLIVDIETTLQLLARGIQHLRAVVAVLNFEAGTDEPQRVQLRAKH